MYETKNMTGIVVLGTIHVGVSQAPVFARRMKEVIQKARPTMIMAELSREQIDGSKSISNRPEYEASIFPAARELAVEILPFMPGLSEKDGHERKMKRAIDKIKANAIRKGRLECIELIEQKYLKMVSSFLERPDFLDTLQTDEYNRIWFEPKAEVLRDYFPEYFNLWESWNRLMFDNIVAAANDYRGKRVLVTVGLGRKFWFDQQLDSRDDIWLQRLSDFT